MDILVTGASGFVGGAIVEWLAAMPGCNIIATGRSHTDRFAALPQVRYVQQDLSLPMPAWPCHLCIHCAGLADDAATEQQFYNNNVLATQHLVKALPDCRQLVYISSASVYAFQNAQAQREEDALLSLCGSAYGRSKLQAEQVVQACGIRSVYILRPRAVYGKGDRVLMPRLLSMIRNNRMVIPARLSRRSSLTHINNLCEAVCRAIDQNSEGVHLFNIADPQPYDLHMVFDALLEAHTRQRKYLRVPIPLIRVLILLGSLLRRKPRLTRQSLDYITRDAELNIEKALNRLQYAGASRFSHFQEQLRAPGSQ